MARETLLVNPRRRSGKRRTAAQRAATRKMIAANRKRGGGRRPARKKTRRRRKNPVGYYVSNPVAPTRRRRRRTTAVARRTRRRNPARRMTLQGVMNNLIIPSATAGAGAVFLDILWGFIPVPPNIKTGPMRHVAKGLGAVTLGWLVGQMATKRMGDTMAMGALTVVFHSAFREMTAQFAPQIPLEGMGYYSAGQPVGYDPSLGYYVGQGPQLGQVYHGPRGRVADIQSTGSNMANNEMGMYVHEGEGYWP